MSETNGENDLSLSERLKRLEASHVKLMTDHEVSWARHEKWVAEQEAEWDREKERWKRRDLEYERDREAWKAADMELGRRIADLVSGFGSFIARLEKNAVR